MTSRAALSDALAILRGAAVPDAPREARRLLAHVQGRDMPDPEAPMDAAGAAKLLEAARRRAAGMPMSHITGWRAFWEHRFRVTPDVLDPRPETETLVALALEAPFARVLDLGTGSGAIIVSLLAARVGARGVGTDISAAALEIAGDNAERIGVTDRLTLLLSDWFDDVGGQYDLIVSNPPYIAASEMPGLDVTVRDHEPRAALTDGGDGLAAYRRILSGCRARLRPGGRCLVEIGPTQAAAVTELARSGGLEELRVHTDLDGRDRVVAARAPI